MSKEQLNNIIIETLGVFYNKEKHLLEYDLSERAIVHKFAEHLQKKFLNRKGEYDYHVDCEYNKDIDNLPSGNKEISTLFNRYMRLHEEGLTSVRIYPDIIIHKRGKNSHNLLVIEIKKSTNTAWNLRNFDEHKLCAYTSVRNNQDRLKYNYGLFLDFITDGNLSDNNYYNNLRWFHNGEEQVDE